MQNLIQLSYSQVIQNGIGTVVVDPPNNVGPPQHGKDFYVSFISIFCQVGSGGTAYGSMDLGEGSPWFPMASQGPFGRHDVLICSQQVGFIIRASNRAKLTVICTNTASGNVNLFLVGNFL